jgi:hypothetical protein
MAEEEGFSIVRSLKPPWNQLDIAILPPKLWDFRGSHYVLNHKALRRSVSMENGGKCRKSVTRNRELAVPQPPHFRGSSLQHPADGTPCQPMSYRFQSTRLSENYGIKVMSGFILGLDTRPRRCLGPHGRVYSEVVAHLAEHRFENSTV